MKDGIYKVWKYPANASLEPLFEGTKSETVAFFRTEFPHRKICPRMSSGRLAAIADRRYVIMLDEHMIFPKENTDVNHVTDGQKCRL